MNAFRDYYTGHLDMQYLRICACFKLLKTRRIGRARAVELLQQRGVHKAERLVEIWNRSLSKEIDILP